MSSRRISKEKALSNKIGEGLDTLDFNYAEFGFAFMNQDGAIQKNAFELVLMLLHYWAQRYLDGTVGPGNMTYTMCHMSYKMMRSLNKP